MIPWLILAFVVGFLAGFVLVGVGAAKKVAYLERELEKARTDHIMTLIRHLGSKINPDKETKNVKADDTRS